MLPTSFLSRILLLLSVVLKHMLFDLCPACQSEIQKALCLQSVCTITCHSINSDCLQNLSFSTQWIKKYFKDQDLNILQLIQYLAMGYSTVLLTILEISKHFISSYGLDYFFKKHFFLQSEWSTVVTEQVPEFQFKVFVVVVVFFNWKLLFHWIVWRWLFLPTKCFCFIKKSFHLKINK